MTEIATKLCIVAQGVATAIITGAIVGAFFGSAYSTFQWLIQ